jgi:iron complex outermembrane receptor protein
LYAQNAIQLNAEIKLTLGVRSQRVDYQVSDGVGTVTQNSQGRTVNAYEIGVRRNFNDGLSLFGRVGSSFRIANVDENRYNPLLLEPQTSKDGEIGADYKSGKNKIQTTVYLMNLNNEIHFNRLVGTFGTNVNLSPTRRYGLELEGTHSYNDALVITAAYSYTVAKFREGVYSGINVSGNNIPLVPRQHLALSSSWKIAEKTALNASMVYVGKQHFDNDQANIFNQKMPAYTTMDVKLSHHQGAWVLAAAVNNLLNEKYFSYGVASISTQGKYNAYPMQERNFSLNATYEF